MKIVHVSLSGSFTENMSYHDNMLSTQNVTDGHVVTIISNCNKHDNGQLVYTEPEDRIMANNVRLIRLECDRVLTPFISGKIRKVKALYKVLHALNPDVILFHGLNSWELLSVARFKKYYPAIKLYADSHSDANNSATNFISKYILHKFFYRVIIHGSIHYIDKVFYLSVECRDFLKSMYHVPEEKMEFYPLGGTIFSEKERQTKRERIRTSLGITEEILCVHSGKMDRPKRTSDIITAFSKVESNRLRLVLVGSMIKEVQEKVQPLINADPRIVFVGWKTADELMEVLCAADVYVQPGGQSATMQNAICCGCAMMLYPHKSHEPYLRGNGYYVKTIEDMREAFEDIVNKPDKLQIMSENSMKIARELLDYKKLAARLYE